ncbi:hypothetical protein TCAL_10191 [Tigriopus californicus]|uniref:Uncharacterized protein n=1 Tax=Tigriopus californicus TaxID=6832 RepID=A0A553NVK1_TIGCA|nr:putative leucine-rich repeat-containing protein DDB_G0290503 isoform X2 [Tigriopus californicus]TRY69458.1 hypothetical protein TCAL_10191 [Tigriopus californicus]|eukprot:TCALIF_10191-PA protein Name:"Protein of unknown function" AED:0.00 eAED:0.00 QI:218/1/0.83/1/0.8/0.66/6/117/1132
MESQKLWREALSFLYDYKKDQNLDDLYRIDTLNDNDQGVLKQHRSWRDEDLDDNLESDYKVFYRQLIEMILTQQRITIPHKVQEVGKLKGFQELTNRLQYSINQHLMTELHNVKNEMAKLQEAVGGLQQFKVNVDQVNMGWQEQIQVNVQTFNVFESRLDGIQESVDNLEEQKRDQEFHIEKLEQDVPDMKLKTKEIEDAQRFLQEAMEDVKKGNEDEKKKVSSTLNQLGDDLKASKEELKVSLEPLIRVTDDVEDVKKRIKKMDEAQADLFDEIKPAKEMGEKLENALEEIQDEITHLKEDLKVRNDDVDDCQRDLREVKENCHQTESGLTDLNKDMERIKADVDRNTKNIDELQGNIQVYMNSRDESDGIARNEFQDKISGIEAKLKDQELTVDDCSMRIQTNTDNLAPLLKFDVAQKEEVNEIKNKIDMMQDKLTSLEGNLNARCTSLQAGQVEMQKVEDGHFTTTSKNLDHLRESLVKINSDWDGLLLSLQQQDSNLKGEAKSWKGKMAALEDQLKRVHDELEKHVMDTKKMNQEMQGNVQDTKDNLAYQADNLNQANDRLDKLRSDFETVKNAVETLRKITESDVEKLTDQTNDNLEKIIALEENNYNQQQRVDVVESLNRRVDLINEQKQMSEAKLMEDLKSTEQSNSNRLAELQQLLQSRIVDLEDQCQTLEKEVKDLEQQVEKHDLSLKNLNADGETIKDNVKQQGIATAKNRSRIEDCENKLSDMEQRVDSLNDNVEHLDHDVNQLNVTITDLNQQNLDELLKRCDQELHKIKAQSEKNEKHVENLRSLNNKLLEEIQIQVEKELNKYSSLAETVRSENQDQLKNIEDRVKKLCNSVLDQCSSDIAELQGSDRRLLDKIEDMERLIDTMKAQLITFEGRDNREEVNQILEKIAILQIEVEAERGRVNATEAMVQNLESNHGALQKLTDNLANQGHDLDSQLKKVMEDNYNQIQSIDNSLALSLNTIDAKVEAQQDDLWTVLLHLYRNINITTLMVESEGNAAIHQRGCLGTYRVVDLYNNKPVYKQDEGDHFLYYSNEQNAWLIGARVGQERGWVRIKSDGHELTPLDLKSTWEYTNHLVHSNESEWLEDDHTLTTRGVPDLLHIQELIKSLRTPGKADTTKV